jgi:hypothetical protein
MLICDSESKVCTSCGEVKSLGEFHYAKHGKHERASRCKQCKREYDALPFNKERRKAYAKKRGYTDADKDYYAKKRLNDPQWYLHAGAKNRAKKRNIEFNLQLDDIIIPEYCPILGIKIEMQFDSGQRAADNSPSLDRIDSTMGYVQGNVAVISYRANVIKNSGTAEEHRKIADWIEENMKC